MIKYAESLQPPELSVQSGNGPREAARTKKKMYFRTLLPILLKNNFYPLVQTYYDVTWECLLPQ